MARTRSIWPGAPTDEDVARMTIWARYLWAYLPCHADREGRLRDSPFTLKHAIFPADEVDVDQLLAELAERRHIIRYEVDGRRFLQLRSFAKHQSPHTREIASEIPAVPRQARPKHDPGDASARPGSSNVSPSPSDPDPDPGPDPSPDPDRDTEAGGGVRQAEPPEGGPVGALWPAWRWRELYALAWRAKYGVTLGGGDAAARATGALADALAALPVPERLAAQARAQAMFAEFLGDASPKPVDARHPWAWFVARFDGLRAPKGVAKKQETLAQREAREKREGAAGAARSLDASVKATDEALERLKIPDDKRPTLEQLEEMRKGTRGLVADLAAAKDGKAALG